MRHGHSWVRWIETWSLESSSLASFEGVEGSHMEGTQAMEGAQAREGIPSLDRALSQELDLEPG